MGYQQDQRLTTGPAAAAGPSGASTSTPSSGTTGASSDASSEQIRQDIARTRSQMDQTLDALGDRLQPRRLLDDVVGWFSSGSGGDSGGAGVRQNVRDAAGKVVDTVKDHPVPALLIGAGLAWLLFEEAKGGSGGTSGYPRGYERRPEPPMYSGSYVDARTGKPYDVADYGRDWRGGEAGQGESAGGQGMMDKAKDLAGAAKDKLSGAAESVRDAASGAADTAGRWMHQATGGAREGYRQAQDYAGQYGGQARDQVRHGYESTRDTVRRAMDDYPLAMGAAAAALGVLAGLILPGTRQEDRLMGETSDQLKDQAKSAGRDLMERGKEVASKTADAAAGEAGRQGLSPGELVEKAGRVVADVGRAAAESAEREGLNPDELGQKVKSVAEHARDTATDEAGRQKDQVKEQAQQGGMQT